MSYSHNTPKLPLSYEKDNSDIMRDNELRISLEFTVIFRSALWFGVLLALFLFPILCWTWPSTREELKAWCGSLQWELCEETQQLLAISDKAIVRWLGQSIDSDGNTPLHILAQQEGNLCLLQVCLLRSRPPHCASVTITNSQGDTPLHFAALHGHRPIVQLLLAYGASVTTTDQYCVTPLDCAVWQGHLPVVQLLLIHGASVTTNKRFNNTPLHCAVWRGHLPIVQLLLTYGASVTTTHEDDNTPLHIAACNGYLPIAQLLLTHGASVTTPNRQGNTPLHCAASYGCLPIVQLLLAHGAPVMAVNNRNETPLLAATLWRHQSVVQFLSNPTPPVFNPSPLQHLTSFTIWRTAGQHINQLRVLFDSNLPPMLLTVILLKLGFED